ncbi:MAG: flagellar assembly protein FliW [Ignavibacterium sp.]|nr:flagellar assembly protein FliW [Ignavibacterium sp.]
MKLKSDQFGEIEFSEDLVLSFEEGLYGFEQLKKYLLIKTDDDLFYWLTSVDRPEICFPLIGTRIIDEEFPEVENYEAFAIVTLNKDPLKITVNLKAPVYINQEKKAGFQKIIDTDKYPINYKLFVEI